MFKLHVSATFHQTKRSGSRVMELMEKKLSENAKNNIVPSLLWPCLTNMVKINHTQCTAQIINVMQL